jgi:hypothetical protein
MEANKLGKWVEIYKHTTDDRNVYVLEDLFACQDETLPHKKGTWQMKEPVCNIFIYFYAQ